MEAVLTHFLQMSLIRVALKCSCLSRKLTLSLIYCAFAYWMLSCFSKRRTALVPPDAVEFWMLSRQSSYLKAFTLLVLEDCDNISNFVNTAYFHSDKLLLREPWSQYFWILTFTEESNIQSSLPCCRKQVSLKSRVQIAQVILLMKAFARASIMSIYIHV